MRRLLAICLLLLTTSCAGGGSQRAAAPVTNTGQQPGAVRSAGALRLNLEPVQDGDRWRVNLTAQQASDLYQIAGTIEVSDDTLRIVNVEAGGDLGGPEDAYFLASIDDPGRIAFAYTMRRFGPGASGSVNLVSVVVEDSSGATLTAARLETAFRLQTGDAALRARDSERRSFEPEVSR